jgi:hypothetical protein
MHISAGNIFLALTWFSPAVYARNTALSKVYAAAYDLSRSKYARYVISARRSHSA